MQWKNNAFGDGEKGLFVLKTCEVIVMLNFAFTPSFKVEVVV